MSGYQGELDLDATEDSAVSSTAMPSDSTVRASTAGNRRLKIIAASSVLFATLTTAVLVRLHASPAPADPPLDSTTHPLFPEPQPANSQVFVAPRLSPISSSTAAVPPTTQDNAPAAAPLSMPLNGPNARWGLPNPATGPTNDPLPPPDTPRRDLLMVDVPLQGGEAEKDQGIVHARHHDAHGLSLAAGSIIGCALETAIDSSRGGYVTCVVTDDVVSDDARAVLIERGTHVFGEYHSDARLGDSRIGIVWNRLRKSDGTTVDLASPGTDQLGRSGVTGAVDNHWFTRIGAAVLLSVIEDGIAAASAPKANGTTLVFGNTAATGSTLSQKVLDASVNLPPTITVSPGARISILVAKDIDFRTAYATR